MTYKKDIESRGDIESLLRAFYEKLLIDPVIGHFFTEVVPLNLETHLPLIADFWESVLLSTTGYRKNVMEIHRQIHEKSPIKPEHFDRWVATFSETIDASFDGPLTTRAKQRAHSIATLMNIKFNHPDPLNIQP
jgi:hemoglobin